jgi:hypothetical protein
MRTRPASVGSRDDVHGGGSSQGLRLTSAQAAAAAAGVALLLVTALLPPQRILSRQNRGDIEEYFDYAHRTFEGQVPYRDFTLEYPPGALPALLAPAPADQGYYNRFRVLMLFLAAAVYDYGYFDLLRGGRVSWMMLARNLILVTLFCSLLLELVARGRTWAAEHATSPG